MVIGELPMNAELLMTVEKYRARRCNRKNVSEPSSVAGPAVGTSQKFMIPPNSTHEPTEPATAKPRVTFAGEAPVKTPAASTMFARL